jgi:hypothetical protein
VTTSHEAPLAADHVQLDADVIRSMLPAPPEPSTVFAEDEIVNEQAGSTVSGTLFVTVA